MQTETARIDIAKPPAEVWALVGEFGGLDGWMAGIDSCTVEGDIRTIQTMGMTLQEQLVRRDAEGRSITYSIVGEGKPVAEHEATITVLDTGDGTSEVTWDVSIEPDEAAPMFKDIYQGALGQVKATLEG